MIFTDDGNIYYDDTLDTLEAGTATENGAGTQTEPGGWSMFYYDKTGSDAYDPGNDWIGLDDDSDGFYTSAGDTLVDADGTGSSGAGSTALSAGTMLYDIVSSDLVVTDSVGTPTKVWQDHDNSTQYTGTFSARSTVGAADGDVGAPVEALTNANVTASGNNALDANEGVYVSADTTLDGADTIVLGETLEALSNAKLTGADGNYDGGEAVYTSANTTVDTGDVRVTAYTGNGGVSWAVDSQSGTITASGTHSLSVDDIIIFTTLASDTSAAYIVASTPSGTTFTVDGSAAQILGAGAKLTPQIESDSATTDSATAALNAITANTASTISTTASSNMAVGDVVSVSTSVGAYYVVTAINTAGNNVTVIGPTASADNTSATITKQNLSAGTESTFTLSSGSADNKASGTTVAAGDGDYNLSIPNTLTNASVTVLTANNALDANEGVYQSADTTYDGADTIVLGSTLESLTNAKVTIIGASNNTQETNENVYVAAGATVANADTRVNGTSAEPCVLGTCADGDSGTNVAATAGWVKEVNATWTPGDDLFIENFATAYTYSAAADTTVDGTAPSAGTPITGTFDTDWTTLYMYDTAGAAWESGSDMIFTDDGNIYYDDTLDTLEAGTATENGAGTQTEPGGWNMFYYASGGVYNSGTDWIGLDSGGSGTYSAAQDVDVYSLGGLSNGDTLIDFPANCDGASGQACLYAGPATIDATSDIYIDVGTAGGAAPNSVVDRQDDQLIGLGVQNDGTGVDTTDISAVNAWVEDGTTVGFQSGEDTLLGAMTVNSGNNKEWRLGGLTTPIGTSGQRIYVTADTSGAPVNGRTMQFALSQYNDAGSDGVVTQDGDVGVFVSSNNDGPTDADLQNANVQTIDITGALTGADVEPASLIVNAVGNATVTFTTTSAVPNDGKIKITFPGVFTLDSGGATTATANNVINGTTYQGTATGQVVTLTGDSAGTGIAASGTVTNLTLSNIQNPATAGSTGTYAIQTTDSADIIIDADNAVTADTITTGALTNTNVQPGMLSTSYSGLTTIQFTTATALPADGQIEIIFPTGFDVSGASSVSGTNNINGGFASITPTGQSVLLIRDGLGTQVNPGIAVFFNLSTTVNPASAGTYGPYTIKTKNSGGFTLDEDTNVASDTIVSVPTTVCGNNICETGEATSCPNDCVSSGGGGGGGGGGGQTSTTSNSTTSTIASIIDTVNADQTYSRPIDFDDDVITVDVDSNTATVQATGPNGTLTIKPNSGSTISLTIPPNTTITGDAGWDGKINPPLIRSLTNIHFNGEEIEGTDDLLMRNDVAVLVEVGGNVPLTFSNEVTLKIPVDLPDGSVVNLYTSGDGDTWMSQGTAVVADGYIIIKTDHLSFFALEMTDETAAVVAAAGEGPAFSDIAGHWAKAYIEEIAALGIVSGKSEGVFAPNDAITRAELTKIATKAFGISIDPVANYMPFSDVATSSWYTTYVIAAKENGIVQGYGEDFRPNNTINRAEALKIMLEAAGFVNYDEYWYNNYSHREWWYVWFMDVPFGSWFGKYVAYAKDAGIISGYADGSFGPANNITRAEVAKIVSIILDMM